MGGKNPLVILDDADLDVAVDCAVQGAFFQTGQRCTASSRLIATEGIHDRFVEATVARCGELRVGHALADDTQIGPWCRRDQLEQDLDYLAVGRGRGRGARVRRAAPRTRSRGLLPRAGTARRDRNDMRINREEIFGPIATVLGPPTTEQALRSRTTPSSGCRPGCARRRSSTCGAVPRPPSGGHRDREPADRRRRLTTSRSAGRRVRRAAAASRAGTPSSSSRR